MSGLTGNNILAGSSGQGGYEIEQSLRFNNTGESVYLERTPSADGNKQVATLSFWIKNCGVSDSGGTDNTRIMYAGNSSSDVSIWQVTHTSPKFQINNYRSGPGNGYWTTDAVYRDPGAWYHYVVSYNQGTVNTYVNGELQSQSVTLGGWSGAVDTAFNSNGVLMVVGPKTITASVKSIYLAEYHWIDGQALDASNFGETNLLTNQWIPKKYVGTYGTNGFYLNFSNSASLGADSSGNGNDFTPTNLAATDQVLDSPTNNFATFNTLTAYPHIYGASLSANVFKEGNLRWQYPPDNYTSWTSGYALNSGKWYVECQGHTLYNGEHFSFGVLSAEKITGSQHLETVASGTGAGWVYSAGAYKLWDMTNGSAVGSTVSPTNFGNGAIVAIALDLDSPTRTVEFFVNNSSIGSISDIDASGVMKDIVFGWGRRSGPGVTMDLILNHGQDSSFAGTKTAQGNKDANGKGDFYYAPPSGYLALCEDNLPDPSIALPGDYFNTVLYTGNGSTQSITGVGFQPDWLWIKNRDAAVNHQLHNVIAGSSKGLNSNTTLAEYTDANAVTSFDSDGWSMNNNYNSHNQSGVNFVAWNWKANGSGVTNTDGTITSTVSANPTAGFSIVSYTGNSTAGATVGHGLSQAPELVITKERTNADSWLVFSKSLGNTKALFLNETSAAGTSTTYWNNTSPSSTVVTLGSDNKPNGSGTIIMYCFHSVEGYSKIGSYKGNGSADGTFVHTGFRTSFVLVKSLGVEDWFMYDGKRDPINVAGKRLKPNATQTEATVVGVDFLSNGFKWRGTTAAFNQSGVTFIYMAFAESPFKYSNAR
jgi:hypothetical protein